MPGLGIGLSLSLGGGAGGASLTADKASFLTDVAQGGLLATLSQPFGSGTTYQTVGTVPGQLALSAGTIVRGASGAAAGSSYSIKVRAISADGMREVAETLTLAVLAGAIPSNALSWGGEALSWGGQIITYGVAA